MDNAERVLSSTTQVPEGDIFSLRESGYVNKVMKRGIDLWCYNTSDSCIWMPFWPLHDRSLEMQVLCLHSIMYSQDHSYQASLDKTDLENTTLVPIFSILIGEENFVLHFPGLEDCEQQFCWYQLLLLLPRPQLRIVNIFVISSVYLIYIYIYLVTLHILLNRPNSVQICTLLKSVKPLPRLGSRLTLSLNALRYTSTANFLKQTLVSLV